MGPRLCPVRAPGVARVRTPGSARMSCLIGDELGLAGSEYDKHQKSCAAANDGLASGDHCRDHRGDGVSID